MSAESAYDLAPCGLLTIDGAGRIVASNRTFTDWVDLPEGQLPPLSKLLRTGDQIYWETHVRPILDIQGWIGEIALELRTGEGFLPVLMNARRQTEDHLIDIAFFQAKERRSYERELLAARAEAERSRESARRLAETLQQSLIPPSLPTLPGVEVAAEYHPAGRGNEVGGDFFDIFQLSATEWLAVIGDVCGKGPVAAAVTAKVRFMIRGIAMETTDLAQLLQDVNRGLVRDGATETCTVLALRIDTSRTDPDSLVMCAAGHPLPILLKSGEAPTSVGKPGTLLGAFEQVDLIPTPVDWQPGDTLVTFTDGITEARRGDDFYGDVRLGNDLRRMADWPIERFARSIVDRAVSFQTGASRDDAAVLMLRRMAD